MGPGGVWSLSSRGSPILPLIASEERMKIALRGFALCASFLGSPSTSSFVAWDLRTSIFTLFWREIFVRVGASLFASLRNGVGSHTFPFQGRF